jgi:hypothetical protein
VVENVACIDKSILHNQPIPEKSSNFAIASDLRSETDIWIVGDEAVQTRRRPIFGFVLALRTFLFFSR